MKLKQYSRKKPCYYCGADPPSTQEHVPPKLMFAAFDCDSITVPSCEKHNNEKSNKDRAIVTALIKSLSRTLSDGVPVTTLPPNVVKAIEFLKPNFAQANKEVSNRSLLLDPELDFRIPFVNISAFDWMRQLSAALVWSVAGETDRSISWDDAFVWNSLYIPGSGPFDLFEIGWELMINQLSEQSIESSGWEPGWSSKPRRYPSDIYNFSICLSPPFEQNKGHEVAFRHQFYSRLNWYVWFTPSQKTKNTLVEAVEGLKHV